MSMKILPGAAVLAALGPWAGADVLYVHADTAPGGDGSSWATAFDDLQDALSDANAGDEIWVARGVYVPSQNGDATSSFLMRSGVELYGGFAGDETERSARDWDANPTILSGDVNQDDTGVGPGWPTGWSVNTANAGHVLVSGGVDNTAVLDGFIVELGHTGPVGTPAGDPLMFGGGLYNIGGSPTVRHCTFRHNLAGFASGGAVYSSDGSPSFTDCRFEDNYVHLGGGGAIATWGGGDVLLEDCAFVGNEVVAQPEATGAGVSHRGDGHLTVTRCSFIGNNNRPFYGVGNITCWGGGLHVFTGGATVTDSVFRDNRAHYGAGIMAWKDITIANCLFENNTATVQPRDPYPEGGGEGAALAVYSFAGATAQVTNSTFINNHGKKHALVAFQSGHLDIANAIIWGNTATHPEFIGYWRTHLGGSFDLDHSCVALIFGPAAEGDDPLDPADLPGCIDLDPLLDAQGRQMAGSPCIDAGSNLRVPAWLMTDLAGAPRFADDPATPDTGNGAAPIVDMGAFEFAVECPPDFTGDGRLDFFDVQAFLQAFSDQDPSADLTDDGLFDFFDVQQFLNAFSAGCP